MAAAHGGGDERDRVDVDRVLEQLDERELRVHGARLRDLAGADLLVVDRAR